jgi:hypothetical protein
MLKKKITPTSFAFLDIMFCGFGAVVLLVMILNGDVLRKREETFKDLRAEFKRVLALEQFAQEYMEKIQINVKEIDGRQNDALRQQSDMKNRLRITLDKTKKTIDRSQKSGKAIAKIRVKNSALTNATVLLRGKNTKKWKAGKKPVGFTGDGRRQYLTGLKLGGERTLILIDSSASMLDQRVVNIIRKKLMPANIRRLSKKWQRAVRSLHWLIANLRPGKKVQVYDFNSAAHPLVARSDGKWMSTDDAKALNNILSAAEKITPGGGTSLDAAFRVVRKFSPKPDSIILLTDGLPSQGISPPARKTLVSAEKRYQYFRDATQSLGRNIPVNILLFPMEGDPEAAGAFWQFAIRTKGSFITPSWDWP